MLKNINKKLTYVLTLTVTYDLDTKLQDAKYLLTSLRLTVCVSLITIGPVSQVSDNFRIAYLINNLKYLYKLSNYVSNKLSITDDQDLKIVYHSQLQINIQHFLNSIKRPV